MVAEGKKTYTHDSVIETTAANDDKSEIDGWDTDSTLDNVATFDEVVVWGHETVVETDNSFVRGVDEWVIFAEAVSSRCSARHTSSI